MSGVDLSVIIPSVNSYSDLTGCLQALQATEGVTTEIIVVDRLGYHVREYLWREFPDVTVIPMPGDATIPQMRMVGIERAAAPFVGVIEDHVLVPPDWGRRMLDELDKGQDVVAGSIANAATDSFMDWAAFLCEYSGSLPPLPEGPAEGVPGNNVVYRKEVLDRYKDVLAECKWENNLHDAMRRDGVTLMMKPDIVVGHKMHYSFRLYMEQRFFYSRSYAGARVAGESMPKKLFFAAAACALPPVLLYRTVSRIVSKKYHVDLLIKSMPLQVAFVCSWALGEAVGALLGPGNALSKVR